MIRKLHSVFIGVCSAGFLLVPDIVMACAVCGGDPEAPMSQGMSMGILTLLFIIGGVLIGFSSFFLFLRRRAKSLSLPATRWPSHGQSEEATL